jgi:hypothetical protein
MDAQGSQTNAKEDTVFLALSGNLTTDLSQRGTDLTASGSGGYEAPSGRTKLTTSREIYARWTATTAEAGVAIVYHGNTAITDYTYAIGTDGSGYLAMNQNMSALWTSSATVGASDYSIAWSTRANPDTTGASDAMISEVVVYDHTGGAIWEYAQFTHAEATTNVSWNFSVGGAYNGAGLSATPTNAPTKVRISTSPHPNVEVFEDWVAARTTYSGSASDGIAEPLGPIPSSSTMGDAGYFAGQHPWAWAAKHAAAVRRRMWSPIVNEVYSDAQPMTQTPSPAQWATAAPGVGAYTLMLQYLRWGPVPPGATHIKARVHVVSYVTAGASVPIGVRLYAFNRPPTITQIGAVEAPALDYDFGEATLDTDHGSASATGEWLDLGEIRLPTFAAPIPGWRGTVWLCLAYDIDPAGASANDANARLVIDAKHARPCYRFLPAALDP